MPGARAVSFIDDITVILPPELSLDTTSIGKVTEWLEERLGVEGILLNRRKSQALLLIVDRARLEHLTEEQRTAMDGTGLTVFRQGMRVAGVPVGTEHFKRDSLKHQSIFFGRWVLGPWMYAVFYAWKYSYGLVCCTVTEQQCLTAAVCVTAPASCFDTVVCLVV